MLETLKVKNFALIDDIEISFKPGLNALTGETGSGKSILLESLSLLFGKRSDADLIRHQAQTADVVGTFSLNEEQQALLKLPKMITISRTIDKSGKHLMKINDELTTLSKLKEVSQSIGSIHSQNDTYLLLDKGSYLQLIDQMDQKQITPLKIDYLLKRDRYNDALAKFNNLSAKKEESIERIELLTEQIKGLESLNLVKDEKKQLDEKIAKLANFDKIKQALQAAYQSLANESFSIDGVYEAYHLIDKIKEYDQQYQSLSSELESSYYQLESVMNDLKRILYHFDFDEDQFSSLQERSYEIARAEVKYKLEANELVDYLETIKNELDLMVDYDNYVNKAKALVATSFDEAYDAGIKLSNVRKKIASSLANTLTTDLRELNLEKAEFKIEFSPIDKNTTILESGLDEVEFYISLNEGEPLKPLAKVASGGEKARFMFALKSIYAKSANLSLLVLDEIDIGISGKTAALVADKMLELSKKLQLIVITHLPQVAARANYHYLITKEMVNKRMQTDIALLDEDKRIEAIALMLSDEQISTHAIMQAKMLLRK